ncbi:hypothetical protein KR018_011532 [Drosophila ironensis]|nr:hypothetical protein KR018_011532 [Drosophila ironensis]
MQGQCALGAILSLLSWTLVDSFTFRSTGNCSFVKNAKLKFICKGTVSAEIYWVYRDHRAPKNTDFSIWESEDSGDAIVLASFHAPALAEFSSLQIEVDPQVSDVHYFTVTGNNKPTKKLQFLPSSIHCFTYSLRYPMELKRTCNGKGLGSDENDVAKMPVLHYASFNIKGSGNDNSATIIRLSKMGLMAGTAVTMLWHRATVSS